MIRSNQISILFLSILIASCNSDLKDEVLSSDKPEGIHTEEYVHGTASVFFTEDMAEMLEASDADVFESFGVTSCTRLFPNEGRFEERKRREGLHRWYRITYNENSAVTRSSDETLDLPGVEIFSKERRISLSSFFNDPRLERQWHYYNNDTNMPDFIPGADINVVPVWDNFTTGNNSVIVAVIDQGVDFTHEDIAANYVGGRNFGTGGKVTPDEHGTHVAGTIAAVNNNGIGVSGVAGGDAEAGIKGAGILSCQIFAGNNPAGAPEAIVWAADNGAIIANNSWTLVFESSEAAKKANIPAELKAAIDYFIKYAGCDENGEQLPDSPMKGGIVLFSAGNEAWDSNPICAYEPVIAVGSVGPDLNRAYYSNYGDWVDIAAPGGNANITSGQILSTLPSNKYGEMQGTSMSCPHVSGIAALIVSYYGGPGFTNEMLKERLLGGARKEVLPNSAKIGPLADALGSMTYGGTISPEKVENYNVSTIGNTVTVRLKVTEDKDDFKTYEYTVIMSTDIASLTDYDFKSPTDSHTIINKFKTGSTPVGEEIELVIKNLSFDTNYYIAIYGSDYAGNASKLSEIKQIKTEENNPPVIESLENVGEIILKSHQSITIPYRIYDPEGGEISVSFNKSLSGASIKRDKDNIWNLTIVATIANPGIYSGEIIATDVESQSSALAFKYDILPNSTPIKKREAVNILSWDIGEKFEFNLEDYFSDPDEEVLTYKVTEGNKKIVTTSIEGNNLTVETTGLGSTSIFISAADAKKSTVQMEIKVVVKNKENNVELYPVPVENILNIRTAEPEPTDICISNIFGQILYDTSNLVVSAFEPATIDMSKYAPGRYKVVVSFAGQQYERVITKK